MSKIYEIWNNELSLAFGRAIQEIRLGKPRYKALRNMAERMDIPEMTRFMATVIQADQAGVSIVGMLRTEAENIRLHNYQRLDESIDQLQGFFQISLAVLLGPSIILWLIAPLIGKLFS